MTVSPTAILAPFEPIRPRVNATKSAALDCGSRSFP